MTDNISIDTIRASVWKSTKDSMWRTVCSTVFPLSDYEIWDSRKDYIRTIHNSIRNHVSSSVKDYFTTEILMQYHEQNASI
jgi:hypothetical protein